jgi:hypothetical protein
MISWAVVMRATMITADPRPMSSAPLDGTPVRLFDSLGSAMHRFGQLNDPGKRLGWGTIVRAGFCSTTRQSNLTTRWDGNH